MESRRPDDWPEWFDAHARSDRSEPGDDETGRPANSRAGSAGFGADAGAGAAPDDHESAYELLQRGQALLRDRHHAQAATVLARAARLEPGKGSILEALGRAYYNSGQHERSAETFTALIEVDPSAHYAHYALGQSLKQLGDIRRARTHLRLACALSPTTPLYRGALARLPELKDDGPDRDDRRSVRGFRREGGSPEGGPTAERAEDDRGDDARTEEGRG